MGTHGMKKSAEDAAKTSGIINTISKFTRAICLRLFRACVRSFRLA
jgi:hypothetical protein